MSSYLCGTMTKMLHKMKGKKRRLFCILFFQDRPSDICPLGVSKVMRAYVRAKDEISKKPFLTEPSGSEFILSHLQTRIGKNVYHNFFENFPLRAHLTHTGENISKVIKKLIR